MKVANVNGLTEGSMVMLGGINRVCSVDGFFYGERRNVITVGMIIRSQYRNQDNNRLLAMVEHWNASEISL